MPNKTFINTVQVLNLSSTTGVSLRDNYVNRVSRDG